MVQCEFCDAVAIAIKRAVADHEEFVWEYDKVKQNYGCVTCQKVVQVFHRENPFSSLNDKLGYVTASFKDERRLLLRERNDDDDDGYAWMRPDICIDMVADPGTPNEFGFSILRHRINIAGIKRWIDQCDHNHTGRCHTITDPVCKLPEATGMLFIDVEKLCLVEQPKYGNKYRYTALSYVWGATIDPFQTTMANFDSLNKPNAFKLPENIWRLPNTIKDSILLTRNLGIQYLWVDRFCIIQDDEITKPYQLASMASIYSNSYVTIAATEGTDSNYGICGIGKKRPRTPPFEYFNFTPGCRMFASSPTRKNSRQVYHTRAWTFQEWTFSYRMIVFHDQTVSWVCSNGSRQENGLLSFQLPSKTPIALWAKWANPEGYCHTVDEYSRRNLSDLSDILTAFDAFVTVQGRAVKGMFHGLPELFFNNMICWHHDIDSPQQRRVDSEGNIYKQFPSWSWAGWIGPTDMILAHEASRIRMNASPGRLTYPCIVDFHKLPKDLRSEKRVVIRDLHWYEARGMTPLVHDKTLSPEDEDSRRKYVVTGDGTIPPPGTNLLYSTVIEFRTRQLVTSLAEHDCNDFSSGMPLILGSKGQMIGALDLRLSLHSLDLPKHNVQLICISVSEPVCAEHAHTRRLGGQYLGGKGCLMDCFVDKRHYLEGLFEPASKWQFRCYDVLWIEWEGEIAYRKAIGQVWKEDWDAADTEEVDIRLG